MLQKVKKENPEKGKSLPIKIPSNSNTIQTAKKPKSYWLFPMKDYAKNVTISLNGKNNTENISLYQCLVDGNQKKKKKI